MEFDLEILNERLNVTENEIWKIISMYWEVSRFPQHLSAFAFNSSDLTDIRNITKSHRVFFDGMEIDIEFIEDNDKFIIFGVTNIGEGPFSRFEHILGYIEISQSKTGLNTPIDIKIVCCWEPFYLFFEGLANEILTAFNQKQIKKSLFELIEFKNYIETLGFKDIYTGKKPQEAIARALLQTRLHSRSYREVPVRGGQSDILEFTKEGRFLYEVKIWRGKKYYEQGLREIEEYIIGEDSNGDLLGAFYVVFDPTKTGAARKYLKSDITKLFIAKHTVIVVAININPPIPSKK